MSLFEEAQTTEQTNGQEESYLDQVVKTKGTNWSDPEVLAKGKLEADTYIQSLEGQLADLRTDMSKQDYAAQLIQELKGEATATGDVSLALQNTASTEDTTTPVGQSEEDLKSLVEKALSDRDKSKVTESNQQLVEAELTKKFGNDAQAEVSKRAKELGMSLDRMQEIASESPNAFLSLMGQPEQNLSSMTSSSIRTESVTQQASSDRDWNYYQKLRKENRNLYYSPKVQQQILDDKLRLGGKFGM
jgi:hypothetical protein